MVVRSYDTRVLVHALRTFDPQLDFRAAFAALDTPSFSLRSGRALQWLDALWSDAGLPGHVGELAHGRWNNRRGRASDS